MQEMSVDMGSIRGQCEKLERLVSIGNESDLKNILVSPKRNTA